MRFPVATLLLIVGLVPATAGEYAFRNRHPIVFSGGRAHISPFPMGKRAADIWASDACWRGCSSRGGWRLDTCLSVMNAEQCRARLDADDRACLRQCRVSGGPLLNITD